MVDSENVVTGFEFPRAEKLPANARPFTARKFVACHHFCQPSKLYSDRKKFKRSCFCDLLRKTWNASVTRCASDP